MNGDRYGLIQEALPKGHVRTHDKALGELQLAALRCCALTSVPCLRRLLMCRSGVVFREIVHEEIGQEWWSLVFTSSRGFTQGSC